MKFPWSGRSMVTAVHDGLAWRAYALKGGRGEWSGLGRVEEPSRNGRQMPKPVLDFLVQSGARRLRVLLAGDVHVLNTPLPEDATDEELHTALAYEAQGEAGLEAAGHRLAAVRSHLFDMGGDRNMLLAAGFETEHLALLAGEAENDGVRFEAAGSLELALLAAHAQRTPNRRLLLVRERSSFYAVPANDPQPFATAMLPLGRNAVLDTAARERADRARERLNAQAALPLTVVLAGGDKQLFARLTPYLGDCRDIELVKWEELEEAAVRLAAGGRPGGVDFICPWIGLPPPPRDPHRHGTVIFGLILAMTLLWVLLCRHGLVRDLHAAQARQAAWTQLEEAREKARGESTALLNRRRAIQAKIALLEKPQILPHGFLPLLETLGESMPPYSCLESIVQREDGGFDLTGLTRWQDGLPQLDAALRDMGRREGLHREFGGLEAIEGEYVQRFRYALMSGEERP